MSSVKPTNNPSWGNYLTQYLPSTKHMMSFICFSLQLTAQAFGNPIPSNPLRRSTNGTCLITSNDGSNNLEIIKTNTISSSILHSTPTPKPNPFQHLSPTPYSFEADKFSLLMKHLPTDLQNKIHTTKSQKLIEKILENVEYQSIDYDDNTHLLAEESQEIAFRKLRGKGFSEKEISQIKQLSIIDQSDFVVEMLLDTLCNEELNPKSAYPIVKNILTTHFTAFDQKETIPAILTSLRNLDFAQFTRNVFNNLQKTIKNENIAKAQVAELHENINDIMNEIDLILSPLAFSLGKNPPKKMTIKTHALNEVVIFRQLHTILNHLEKFFDIMQLNYLLFQTKNYQEVLRQLERLFFFETARICSKKEPESLNSLIYSYIYTKNDLIEKTNEFIKMEEHYYNHPDSWPNEASTIIAEEVELEEFSIPNRPKNMKYQDIIDNPALEDENLTVTAEHHYLTYGMTLIAGLSVIFTLLAQCKVKPDFPTRADLPPVDKPRAPKTPKEELHSEVIPTFNEMLTHLEKRARSCIASSKCNTIASLYEEVEKYVDPTFSKYSKIDGLKSEIEKKIPSFNDHIKMVVEKELKNNFTKQIDSAITKHPNYDIIAICNLPEVKNLSAQPLFQDYLTQNKTDLNSMIYDVFIETFHSQIQMLLQGKKQNEDALIQFFNKRHEEKGICKAWINSPLFQDYCKNHNTGLQKFVRETIQAMLKANN